LGVELIDLPVHDSAEIERALDNLALGSSAGVAVLPDNTTVRHRELIIASVAKHALPAVYPYRYFAMNGGLVSYGTDTVDSFRRAASYVDRILRGAKPAELPVQQSYTFELVINLKSAKALGLDIPPTLLARANEVRE
jgi:putative ABC transport system substrate-binding protein